MRCLKNSLAIAFFSCFFSLLSGCASAPTAYAPNFNSLLLKKYPVCNSCIKINKKINIQTHNTLLIVAFNSDETDTPTRRKMKAFFINAIKNMHVFKHVVLVDDVSDFLNKHGQYNLSKLDYNYSDNIAELAFNYPGVLVANFYSENFVKKSFGPMYTKLTLEIIDPTTDHVYLKIQYAKDSAHVNQFYYAAANGIKKWASKNN